METLFREAERCGLIFVFRYHVSINLYQYIYRHGPEQLIVEPRSEMLTRVAAGSHAYIDWMSNLEWLGYEAYTEHGNCHYEYSKDGIFHEHVAIALPKHSPWTARFNHEIKMMLQSGLAMAWKKV